MIYSTWYNLCLKTWKKNSDFNVLNKRFDSNYEKFNNKFDKLNNEIIEIKSSFEVQNNKFYELRSELHGQKLKCEGNFNELKNKIIN